MGADVNLLWFSLLSKNKSRFIKSPVCLSVCPLLITFEQLGRFHEIWCGGNVIQGDPDAINFTHSSNHFKIIEVQSF
jgi:hypothetical protein